ncbi:MAG: 30S ribosomal protein S16 [Metamycoplasmataceae bacterium]
MVKLRLKRMGCKFNAFYRIVAAEAKAPRDGRFIEELGYFNPISNELKLEKDLILKWLKEGAQPTSVVKDLFKKEKIWAEFMNEKNNNKPKKTSTTTKKTSTKPKTTKVKKTK